MSSLLNVWKFFGKLRKRHQKVQKQTFQQVSKTFENLQKSLVMKSLEIFRKIGKCCKVLKTTFQHFKIFLWNLWKSLEVFRSLNLPKISEICRKVLKITFHHFKKFFKSSEIVRSLQKSSEKNQKMFESSQNNLLTISENFWKCWEMLGKLRKPSENFQTQSKIYEKFL